jgi:PAS domain S-box-containing protein
MTHGGTHDGALVALSVLIAMVASYTALDLAGRIRASEGWARHAWLTTAAIAMGGGIWAMHFVAMLAFQLPDTGVNYDISLTGFSFLLPIVVTGISFHMVNRADRGPSALLLGGLLMGLGIAAMHYAGMAAMRMAADLSYDAAWVAISILIAIGAASIALWLAFRSVRFSQRILAAVAMGVAIAGMHYAAMQGAIFAPHPGVDEAHGAASLNQTNLALAVSATTFLILFLALIAAMFDRRFAYLAEREAMALRENEERFRTLYSKTPLPLFTVNADRVIQYASDAWLDLLGYSREEVEGRAITDFISRESVRDKPQPVWTTLLKVGELKDVEYQLMTKDGRILDVLMSGRVVRDPQGRFAYVLGGVVDVTARKRAEEALRQAQKIEAVGALTGGIAHEFNNLLAVILGNLDLLSHRLPEDPKIKRLLDTAIKGAERGAALTQRMLAFARRQELRSEAIDVPDLVKGMADLLQRSIGPMVRIETRFPLKLPHAQVDANQLELALLNLAVNARDAMPQGGVITIAAREEIIHADPRSSLAPGRYVCLSVADTGEGMDEATLSRAMEPFFTTKGVGKGTGLGLSMVHGLAAQSGGGLVLKSRKHQGTTAEIWLPVAPVQPAVEPAMMSEVPGRESTTKRKALTVLAVDDDPLVLHNTAAMLEDLEHKVIEIAKPEEALAYLSSGGTVDLVITDQAMPGMTGTQLAQKIRAQWPHLPVILATGYADLPTGADAGLVRLSKPFRQNALIGSISEALQARQQGDNVVPLRPRLAAGQEDEQRG